MKLKKLLEYYPTDKFLVIRLLSSPKEEICLDPDTIVYTGMSSAVPYNLRDYKVGAFIPDLRISNYGDEKRCISCAEGMINVFIYEKRGEEDCI